MLVTKNREFCFWQKGWWVKCLVCRANLRSYNHNTGVAGAVGTGRKQKSQPSWTGELHIQWETLPQAKVKNNRRKHTKVGFWTPNIGTHMSIDNIHEHVWTHVTIYIYAYRTQTQIQDCKIII